MHLHTPYTIFKWWIHFLSPVFQVQLGQVETSSVSFIEGSVIIMGVFIYWWFYYGGATIIMWEGDVFIAEIWGCNH